MSPTRERQKAQRRARILKAAEKLIQSRGYAETNMQEIALRSDLAVGTLYNYFPSKPDLVLALLDREVGEALRLGEEIIKRPPSSPIDAVFRLLDLDFSIFVQHDRPLWRELVSSSLRDSEIGAMFFASDARLVNQLQSLLVELKTRGDLRQHVDTDRAAVALYGVFFAWFMAALTNDALSFDDARAEVGFGVSIVMDGLLDSAKTSEKK